MRRKSIVCIIIFAFVFIGAIYLHKNALAILSCTPSSIESGDCVPSNFRENNGPTSYDTSPGIDVTCYSGKSFGGIGGGGLQQCMSVGAVKGEAYKFNTFPTAVDPTPDQNASIFICVNASGQLNDQQGLCWGWNKYSYTSTGSPYTETINVYKADGGSIKKGYRYFVLQATVHDSHNNPNWHSQHLTGYGTKVSGGPSVSGNTISWSVGSADNATLFQNGNQVAGGALNPPYDPQGGPPTDSQGNGYYNYVDGPKNFILQVWGPDENGLYKPFDMPVNISNSTIPPDYHLACGQGVCVQVPNGFAGQGNDDWCTVEGEACGGGGNGNGHLACVNSSCGWVSGAGSNVDGCTAVNQACGDGSPPILDINHLECQGQACVVMPGGGADQCNTNADCGGVVPVGPTCGTMQQDSAIRGCSGYVEKPPVPKPDAVSCASYCGQNNANACEWYSVTGECYVEFGIGCSVEGGHSGWYAATMSSCSTHNACSGQSCVQVSGAGSNLCNSNADCGGVVVPPTHSVCQGDGSCSIVNGAGSNQCTSRSDCPQPTHNVCMGDGSCTSVSGAGISQCTSRSDCPQPPPSCSFSASPNKVIVPPPANVTLSWSCSYVDSCTISSIGPVGPSGSQNVSVNKDTTYTLNCSGAGGPGSFSTIVRAFEYSGGKLKEVAP